MGIITTTTFSSDSENVTRTKLNNLVANLKTEFNGNIDNANIASDAAIVATKLDLSTIASADTDPVSILNNTGNGPHLRFTGDPTVASPTDGDLWFDGTNFKVRVGATTYNIDVTAA